MSTIKEIEAALPQLSAEELQHLRDLLDDLLEDELDLRDEVVQKVAQSKREIAQGQVTFRKP